MGKGEWPLVGKCSATVPGSRLGTGSHTSAGLPLRRLLYSRQGGARDGMQLIVGCCASTGMWARWTGGHPNHTAVPMLLSFPLDAALAPEVMA